MFLSSSLFLIVALIGSITCWRFEKRTEAVDLHYHCQDISKAGVDNVFTKPKSPVLLIHGLSETIPSWNGFSQNLARRTGRKVCSVDLRNHGDSPYSDLFNIEVLTADIERFLEEQKIEKVNIIGHSIGGKTGVHFSFKNPHKVDSLVVEDMRPNGITEEALTGVRTYLRLLQQAIESLPEGLNKQEARESIGNYVNEKLRESGSQVMLSEILIQSFPIRSANNKWYWKLNMNALNNAVEYPEEFLTESNGLYLGQTLFIYGTASAFDVGGDKKNIMKLFPFVKLIPVEGAGHWIHDNYQEFEEEVVKLLNQS